MQRTDWWLPEAESEGWAKRVSAIKWISPGDVMYNIATSVNSTILYTWNFLSREILKYYYHTLITHTKTHKKQTNQENDYYGSYGYVN